MLERNIAEQREGYFSRIVNSEFEGEFEGVDIMRSWSCI